ncbi:hypothetical protein Taro_009765 [Colocasia esculenta]|uniref:Cathepsin propeptide inhibitor domain-containing protein n=1 Tax=Colocasia esculenta TaxID=4460 RepID=A0A843UAY3_COLES|nr:hypothetical protein [Colocasia esculenta]
MDEAAVRYNLLFSKKGKADSGHIIVFPRCELHGQRGGEVGRGGEGPMRGRRRSWEGVVDGGWRPAEPTSANVKWAKGEDIGGFGELSQALILGAASSKWNDSNHRTTGQPCSTFPYHVDNATEADEALLNAEGNFAGFLRMYEKLYATPAEHNYRFSVFKANLRHSRGAQLSVIGEDYTDSFQQVRRHRPLSRRVMVTWGCRALLGLAVILISVEIRIIFTKILRHAQHRTIPGVGEQEDTKMISVRLKLSEADGDSAVNS